MMTNPKCQSILYSSMANPISSLFAWMCVPCDRTLKHTLQHTAALFIHTATHGNFVTHTATHCKHTATRFNITHSPGRCSSHAIATVCTHICIYIYIHIHIYTYLYVCAYILYMHMNVRSLLLVPSLFLHTLFFFILSFSSYSLFLHTIFEHGSSLISAME